ncbi:MAG TPA: AMP-binding protein [Casimicrobiaceae bacterium]|jgi:phenylacetate-CoA ligase
MSEFFDALETRDPEKREREQLARLPIQIAHAKSRAPAYARLLADVDPAEITSREALAGLPLTRKSELASLQEAAPPLGGFTAGDWSTLLRVFASPGPIYEPEGRQPDYWRIARALYAAGFRRGDLVHNAFAYHMTPAGAMLESAAHALGCTVFPAGTGQTEQQVHAIARLRPAGYVGTPSFLKILLDKADEAGVSLDSVRRATVSGEAFPAALRTAVASHGIEALQLYATADLGNIAYETPARDGLVIDEGVLVEIVRPGTGQPVPDGEVGEVVVTPLFNSDYPVVRFATGDLSAIMPGRSPCGRTNARLRGWLGRADQTTKVRGMFVQPGQIAAVVARHAGVLRARLVVDNPDGMDRMTLHAECADAATAMADAIVASLRDVTKLRGEVAFVAPGSLPNDGKVIDDRRRYD